MPTNLVAAIMVAVSAVGLPGCTSPAGHSYVVEDCTRADLGGRSVARVWDEALLDAVRRDTPAPTVHARNLFHTSAAMWDAWAAYDPDATGYFVTEKLGAGSISTTAAREAAISFAAYRLLVWRYSRANGQQETYGELANTMRSLCYDVDFTSTQGRTPAALGNRIAAAAIAYGLNDGSLEAQQYVDTSYQPVNSPLVVAESGAELIDPNHWQPLELEEIVAQNGLPIPGNVQNAIGPHWGFVRSFALRDSPNGTPIDPGPPPMLGDPESDGAFKDQIVEVIRASSQLDPNDGVTVDIGPGTLGDNTLGTNDGDGRDTNPLTGEPYAPNVVPRGDFGRALAQFWADGPASETPPGHWNTIANSVSEETEFPRQIGGAGPEVDRLEWDVKLYFALNGALHDAAITAWGLKRHYDSVRPISAIRYMGSRGQSSKADGLSYDPEGLPLVPGLVEVVTARSSASGERHGHLAEHVGEVAILAWRGNPVDPATQTSGVGWVLAVDWVPFQLATFVTPSFPGYVSGHSTFSRAAAEVLTALTDSPYFPGGLSEWTVPADSFVLEQGPSQEVTLQWATYFDAADQAGRSRLFGGIHIAADDFGGRRLGSRCGELAWALAVRHFDGSLEA